MAGQILNEAPKASKSILKQGDKELSEEQKKFFLAMIAGVTAIGSLTRGFSNEVTGKLNENMVNEFDTRLTLRAVNRIHKSSVKGLKTLLEEIDSTIRGGVARAIVKSSRMNNGLLVKYGLPPLSPKQLESLQSKVFGLMDQEFPLGSGITYRMRLERLHRMHSQQLKMILKRSHSSGNVLPNIMRDIRSGLSHTGASRTPIVGGSAAKKLQRIMIAEESRLAREVERQVFQTSGVNFGYWRLSPLHIWYGGNEICEVLASAESSITSEDLVKSGKALSGVPLAGLYPLNKWPGYPHPHCKCYLEPLF